MTAGLAKDPLLDRAAETLRRAPGLRALVLGGSRARGTATTSSDYDLGLYYDPATPLDTDQLQGLVQSLVDDPAHGRVTPIGGWGPWINGGGWLSIGGRKVDLIYRDIAQVRAVIAECREGRVTMHYQPGHPHGFCSAIWAGEIDLCQPLFDEHGLIAELKSLASPYPAALGDALLTRFRWEIDFAIDNGETALGRGDATHIAGCAHRALSCLAQTLFAANQRYLINEKGALAEAVRFSRTIADLAKRVDHVWTAIGARDFRAGLNELRACARDVDRMLMV